MNAFQEDLGTSLLAAARMRRSRRCSLGRGTCPAQDFDLVTQDQQFDLGGRIEPSPRGKDSQ